MKNKAGKMLYSDHLHQDVGQVGVPGAQPQGRVELLDEPGPSLGVPHGCSACGATVWSLTNCCGGLRP